MSSDQAGFSARSLYSNGRCQYKQSADIRIDPSGSVITISGKVIELYSISRWFIGELGKKKATKACEQENKVGGPALYITLSRAPEAPGGMISMMTTAFLQELAAPSPPRER